MDLRSPTSLMSPTCPNSSTSDGPQKSMLTLYWPTAITIAKPHVLSTNTPSNNAVSATGGGEGGSSGYPHRRSSKWLLGWNPRGLVVVVGAVLEVPSLSACQSVLEELHRDPPLGCDQSVIKYLRILGRLDADGSGAHDEKDEIQTNRLKNTEDIWIELASVNASLYPLSEKKTSVTAIANPYSYVSVRDLHCCGYRQPVSLVVIRYDPREQYPTGTYTTTPLASVGAIMSQAATDGSSAKLANIVLAPGARSRLEGQYVDPIVQQLCAPPLSPTTTNANTTKNNAPSTSKGSDSHNNARNKSERSNSKAADTNAAKHSVAKNSNNNDSSGKNNQSSSTCTGSPTTGVASTSTAGGLLLASGSSSAAQPKTLESVVGEGEAAEMSSSVKKAEEEHLAASCGNEGSIAMTSPSPSAKTASTAVGAGGNQRTPQRHMPLNRNMSNEHVSAMAAEMLQQEQEQAVSKTSPLLYASAVTPHNTPQRRGVSSSKGAPPQANGSSQGPPPPSFHLGPNMSLTGSFGQGGAVAAVAADALKHTNRLRGNTMTSTASFEIKSSVSVADAATNDSFGSDNSFQGQVPNSYFHSAAAAIAAGVIGGGGRGGSSAAHSSAQLPTPFSANKPPRLRYDTYESFTEFSVILKCCNASALITESLFEMEETLAEAEEERPMGRDSGSKSAAHIMGSSSTSSSFRGGAYLSPSLSSLNAAATTNEPKNTSNSLLLPRDPTTPTSATAPTQLQREEQKAPPAVAVDNSSLVTPQSSMRRRRRADDVAADESALQHEASQSINSSLLGASSRSLLARRGGIGRASPLAESSNSNYNNKQHRNLSEVIHGLAVAAEAVLVPFILTVLLPFLAYVRDYSYVMRLVEYRAMEVVNALSIIAGKSTACGLHPTVPHALEGTTANQRFWCVARCFLQIGVDMALGWIVSLWLINFQEDFFAYVRPSAWYGLHDMHIRYLDWFEGWPGGFKMNDDLNLFISFFTRTCLGIWQSIVTYNTSWDWLSIAMSGLRLMCFFGLSFGLNFVSDCCNIATLHLRNAFHILRVVYVWFGSVIRSLTLQFRGKRVNPLRRRVDDFEFENDQTVIGMLMCTCVIFLFPTMALHYFYLAIVRTSVWFVQEFFCALGFIVGNLPLASFMFWVLHRKEVVKGLAVSGIQVDPVSGTVVMTLVAKHMQLSEAFIDWLTLIRVVTSPLQPQKLLSFIISATLKPAINARNSVYPHLCANCVSPCLSSLAGQTSESS